ncbi:MAG: HAMP domain-containing protein [Candidatus Hydrogenedentes bacterium]|nr:HAMP domain-containing protein [Candidatus Hydrogenedentota bacterium]
MAGLMRRIARLPFSSLRARLHVLIVLATLPAVLFIFFVAARERGALLDRMETDARHVADLASREHGHQILGARELLRWLGTKLSAEGPQSPSVTNPDFLRALLAGHPQLANIGLLSPSGQVLASVYPLPESATMARNPAFLAALESQGVATGTYLVSPILQRPTLNHAYAVRDSDGQVLFVLFCGLDLTWLGHLAKEVTYAGPFSMFIADREGRILTYANGGELAAPGADGLHIPELAAVSESGRGRLLNIGGSNARRYVVSSKLQDDPNLYVAVSLPYDEVVRQSNAVFYRTLIILALLTLFTTTTVYFATEIAVLRALRLLARTVQRFGAGDLTARVPIAPGYNELTSLGRTFNTMANALAARHAEAIEAQNRLRALSSRVQQVREAEATRIARELHDEVGQCLTSLKFELSRLPAHCAPGKKEPCADSLQASVDGMKEQVTMAIDFVRRISSDLRPSVLDKLGLAAALEWQAQELEARTGLIIEVDTADPEPELDEQVTVTLFRIAQEALTNVVRHAGAGLAEVRLAVTTDGVLLEVKDDGAGLPAGALDDAGSLGIVGMRERALLVGAQLTIESVAGGGTAVRVLVPRIGQEKDSDAYPAGG